jgi:hypothetical protein
MRELTELRIWAAGGMEEQALLPLDLDNKEEVRVANRTADFKDMNPMMSDDQAHLFVEDAHLSL